MNEKIKNLKNKVWNESTKQFLRDVAVGAAVGVTTALAVTGVGMAVEAVANRFGKNEDQPLLAESSEITE